MSNSEGKIVVHAWLKNSREWYIPQNKIDLSEYENIELLFTGFYGDVFYCWNKVKEDGRLFRGRWNKGIR